MSACGHAQMVKRLSFGSRAVLLTLLLPPQIRVRSTPDSRHDSDGPEHLRLVPAADVCSASTAPVRSSINIQFERRTNSRIARFTVPACERIG
jgi:hypothetical protein